MDQVDKDRKGIKKKLKERAHSDLSASGSERWLSCAGSVILSKKAPAQPESSYAREGTIAHGHLEAWLNCILFDEEYVPPTDLLKNREMYKAVEKSVDFIESRLDGRYTKLFTEERLHLDHIDPEMFGTGDVGLVNLKKRTLEVWDFKYGSGKVVDVSSENERTGLVEYNTQLMFYAIGFAKKFNYAFDKVTIGVLQPRAEKHGEWIRSETVDIDTIHLYERLFKKGVARVRRGDHHVFPGPWCHWCPAKNFNCPHYLDLKNKKAADMFPD